MLMRHGMHLYLNQSTHIIGCIYLQPHMCLKKEKLTWFGMRHDEDMKGVPLEVVQHMIPIRDHAKPVQQGPYDMNPKYHTTVKEDIDKLLDAGFIYKIEYTEWVSPIVIVTKKNGKIQVCVDIKKVNVATVRDYYPLPFTKHVLERVAGHEAYGFLDKLFGYNQVSIDPKDQQKTALTTTWDVFAHRKMHLD